MICNNVLLTPKGTDGILKVLTLGRISTPHQDAEMINVQHQAVEQAIGQLYTGKLDFIKLGEQASGEDVSRETYLQAIEVVKSGEMDLAMLYDISKASRSAEFAWKFINTCFDYKTRFISINDGIDTADPNWELSAHAAVFSHGMVIPQTRYRVASQGNSAFDRGGMVTKVPVGYFKLTMEQSASGEYGPPGLRMAKDPEFTEIVKQLGRLLLSGSTYEQIAAWLNENNVALGPYAISKRWSGKMVRQYLENPLLHGERRRSQTTVTRQRTTGRKVRNKNSNPRIKCWPTLAHLSKGEHDEILDEMSRRKTEHPRLRNKRQGTPKKLDDRLKSKTLFPGQLMTCSVCGGLYYWTGRDCLKCCNAGDPGKGACWNHVQVDPTIASSGIKRLLLKLIDEQPAVSKGFFEAVTAEYSAAQRRENRELDTVAAQIKSLERERGHLIEAIKSGQIDSLVQELQVTEQKISVQQGRLKALEQKNNSPALPPSRDEIWKILPEILDQLLKESYDFSDLLRKVIPVFEITPLQAVDSGRPVARARVVFDFERLQRRQHDATQTTEGIEHFMELWNRPMHLACLDATVRVHREQPQWSAFRIGQEIGEKRWNVTGALQAHKKMQQLGVSDPYVPVTDPSTVSRWRMTNSHVPRWDQTK